MLFGKYSPEQQLEMKRGEHHFRIYSPMPQRTLVGSGTLAAWLGEPKKNSKKNPINAENQSSFAAAGPDSGCLAPTTLLKK